MSISVEITNFSNTVYLMPYMNGFHLELGIGARGQKARMMGLLVWRYLQPFGYNTQTWWTGRWMDVRTPDTQTLTDSKDCTYA